MDLFVADFALERLTLVPYSDWRTLPPKPGIYFALDADGGVVYIGQTQNLMERWASNFRRLYYTGAVTIGYLLIDRETVWRQCLERTLIKTFKPSAHGKRKVMGPKGNQVRPGERRAIQKAMGHI